MSQRPSSFRPVAPHTYLATAPFQDQGLPAGVTIGLVVGADAALLVDAGGTLEQARQLVEAAAAVTDRPVTAVLLTHWHHDHAYGIAGMGARTVIAHESVGPRLADADTPVAVDHPVSPDRTVAVATAVDLGGGVRVEAVHLGRGHTDGDLVVAVPGDDVVFAGDLVESAGPPQYDTDSFPHEWPATLDGLIGLTSDRTVVVPGHGDPLDREAVFEQRSRIAAVSGEISRLAGLGVGLEDAASRGEWALPFEAVRRGYEVGCAQVRGAAQGRSLPLV